MAGLALPLTPQNLSNKPLKLQSYPNAMQRQILVHAGVWLVSSKLNKAESWSWETVLQSTDPSSQHSRPGSFPHEGHTSSAGCTGRPDSASQFADGIPWMLGLLGDSWALSPMSHCPHVQSWCCSASSQALLQPVTVSGQRQHVLWGLSALQPVPVTLFLIYIFYILSEKPQLSV